MSTFNERQGRSLAKVVSWRVIQTISHTVNGFITTGSWIIGLNIAGWALVINSTLYWLHERGWNRLQWARMQDGSQDTFLEKWTRSLSKTVTWRVLITISNFVIPFIVTGNLLISLSFLTLATLLNMVLYWAHERAWNYLQWGKQMRQEVISGQ